MTAATLTRLAQSPECLGPQATGPRVALVVDHPLRDLAGLMLTGMRLCDEGIECILVPANLVFLELERLAPDFVLLNYLRRIPAHMQLYRSLLDAGIGVGVLDTEGGVVESPKAFTSDLATDARIRDGVSCYCTWGPVLSEHLVRERFFRQDQMFVTGCPRTDFYAVPWRQVVERRTAPAAQFARNLILINTNFSLGNPAMLSQDEQFQMMVDRLGHPPERVRRWQENELAGMRGLAALANQLADRFPEATVVVRPHPFERLDTYHELLRPLPNLHCVRKGTVESWLVEAKVVIQRSCSTSIESSMLGTPALAPSWLPTAFERPAANRTSVSCQSAAELASRVEEILDDRFTVPIGVARDTANVVKDWFFQVDGKAHDRVARIILDHLPKASRAHRVKACRSLVYTRGKRFPHRRWLKGQVRRLLGVTPEWSPMRSGADHGQRREVERWEESLKQFDLQTVNDLAKRISEVGSSRTPGYDVLVNRTESGGDYVAEYAFGRSIKLIPGRWTP